MDLGKLMTSDFIEGHSPDELINFLIEFRKNYRILQSKNTILERKLKFKDLQITEVEDSKIELKKRNDILIGYLNRRGDLSWKERISGKINKINYGIK